MGAIDPASRTTARRFAGLGRVIALAGGMCLVAISAGVPAATASEGEVGVFGHRGTGAGEFREPRGIAVSEPSGDVSVGDTLNARLERFDAGGQFLLGSGWGVADRAAAAETCTAACFEGLTGSGAGQFSFPEGVAVDNDALSASYGDVYVGDRENHRVEKVDAAGQLLLMFGGGVNLGTSGDICDAGEECGAGTEGGAPGEFTGPSRNAIAVDASGNVFVGDSERVQEFTEAGALIGAVAIPGGGRVSGLAVDGEDHLYVIASELTGVHKYNLAGEDLGTLDGGGVPLDLTIGAAGALFIGDNFEGRHHILEFDASGSQIASFDAAVQEGENGIAFSLEAGLLDVLTPRHVRVIRPPVPGPLAFGGSARGVARQGAELTGFVNPEGSKGVTYSFEYGPTEAYGTSTSAVSLPGEGFEDEEATAVVAGLQPATSYHFRVVAIDALSRRSVGSDTVFTTQAATLVGSEAVSEVTGSSARLEAQLDPLGTKTSYTFEYGPSASYGTSVPLPEASLEAGHRVDVLIEHLEANVRYHYRVHTVNEFGVSGGPDQSFTTRTGTAGLIDGRRWEMVSPVQKDGNTFEPLTREGGIIQAAANGTKMAYVAKGPVGDGVEGNRSLTVSQLISTRVASGTWSTEDVATPHQHPAGLIAGELSEYRQFSPQLEVGLVTPQGATPLSPQATERTPYLRTASGAFVPLLNRADVEEGVQFGGRETQPEDFEGSAVVEAATPDLQEVIIGSQQPLTSEVEGSASASLFAWHEGRLQLASVLPDGSTAASRGLSAHVGDGEGLNVINAVSADGSRVVFQTSDGALYVRDLRLGLTARVDVPEAGWPSQPQGEVEFQTSSSDDSLIYFSDTAQLGRFAHTRERVSDLYACRLEGVGAQLRCNTSDVSRVLNAGESADVQQHVLGSSDSGRYVYFVANGVLAAGAEPGTCVENNTGELGSEALGCSLYVADLEAGTTQFIARLTEADAPDWGGTGGRGRVHVTSGASADGLFVSFMSSSSLTGFENRDARSGVRDEEVYLYNLALHELTCASCNSRGALPKGVLDTPAFPFLLVDHPGNWWGQWLAGSLPSGTHADLTHSYYVSRFLSDSGRLLFMSPDQLVSGDANGLEDVYEYEPAGVGNCGETSGCVGLISSGASGQESAFLDASIEGEDVFFLTNSALVGKDQGTAADVYDAHACVGGAACGAETPPAVPSAPCGGADECREGPASQPLAVTAPASATLSGKGNLAAQQVVAAHKATRKQLLKRALAKCARKHDVRKRRRCTATARSRFGKSPAKHGRR